jgi:hypothetical protein
MPDVLSLTGPEVRVTANSFLNPCLAVDVSEYDTLQIDILATCLIGTGAVATIYIYTGMQTDTIDGWVLAATGTTVTAAGPQTAFAIGPGGFLRYIGWQVAGAANLSVMGFRINVVGTKRSLAIP